MPGETSVSESLRVGIIGANAESGWARESHVPAVQRLDGLSLAAVATNTPETAKAAERAFGVRGYASGADLIADPNIDLVTVATRVPDHRALVLAAIGAGKHVYSEWPLGRSPDESREMADAAQRAGIHAAIGLQLRESPATLRARALLASGAIGRLLSVSGFSSVAGFGKEVPPPFAYLEEPANFANLVTIQGAHMLDLAIALIGWPTRWNALVSRQFPKIRVAGDQRQRTTFDHLLVHGHAGDGVPLSLEIAGGRSPDTPFHLELIGERGVLRLSGIATRGLQSGRLALARDGSAIPLEDPVDGLDETAVNVAGVYARLRDDISSGTRNAIGFDHAVRLTAVIQSMLETGSV